MTTNKNDSAFPYMEGQTRGLTKREYFAGQALQGMLVGYPGQDELPRAEIIAADAIAYGDALIAVLNGTGESS